MIEITIDRSNKTIGTLTERYSFDEDWVKSLTTCRVCKKPIDDDDTVIRAYKTHQAQLCSSKCSLQEVWQKYACCEKAVPTFCSCAYSLTCPDHGDRHVGTHD